MKRFSELLEEELSLSFSSQGIFSSSDIVKLVGEIKKLIGYNIKDIEYVEFEIKIILFNPLLDNEKKEIFNVLDSFGYSECFLFLNPLSLSIKPKYSVKVT